MVCHGVRSDGPVSRLWFWEAIPRPNLPLDVSASSPSQNFAMLDSSRRMEAFTVRPWARVHRASTLQQLPLYMGIDGHAIGYRCIYVQWINFVHLQLMQVCCSSCAECAACRGV